MKHLIKYTLCYLLMLATCGCTSNATNKNVVSSDEGSKTASVNSSNSSKLNNSSQGSTVSMIESLYPEDDWREHPEDFNLIAFTFDDAPSYSSDSGNATASIIETLCKYNGAGTLFVVGKNLDQYGSKLLKHAVINGFELGNHTYAHKSVKTDAEAELWSEAENLEDFAKCQDLVEAKTGVRMKYFRPAGAHTNEVLYSAISQLGMPCVAGNRNEAISDWDRSVKSWQIAERILNNTYDGAIILLHGWNPETAEAIKLVCDRLYKQGYRFCTVDELFYYKGKTSADVPADSTVYGFDPETGEIQTTRGY